MKKKIIIVLSIISLVSSCKKHDEEEAPITTVIISLESGGNTVKATWSDPDGPGGSAPVIDTLSLTAGKLYNGKIEVQNISQGKTTDLTPEIQSLKNMHQFFYTPESDSIKVLVTDRDDNGVPVGLTYTLQTPVTGLLSKMRIILSHYDGVTKTTSPTSDLDMDITYPVKIQ